MTILFKKIILFLMVTVTFIDLTAIHAITETHQTEYLTPKEKCQLAQDNLLKKIDCMTILPEEDKPEVKALVTTFIKAKTKACDRNNPKHIKEILDTIFELTNLFEKLVSILEKIDAIQKNSVLSENEKTQKTTKSHEENATMLYQLSCLLKKEAKTLTTTTHKETFIQQNQNQTCCGSKFLFLIKQTLQQSPKNLLHASVRKTIQAIIILFPQLFIETANQTILGLKLVEPENVTKVAGILALGSMDICKEAILAYIAHNTPSDQTTENQEAAPNQEKAKPLETQTKKEEKIDFIGEMAEDLLDVLKDPENSERIDFRQKLAKIS